MAQQMQRKRILLNFFIKIKHRTSLKLMSLNRYKLFKRVHKWYSLKPYIPASQPMKEGSEMYRSMVGTQN
jgi:hypothetical protein